MNNWWSWVDDWPLETVKWAPGAPGNVDTTSKKVSTKFQYGVTINTTSTPVKFFS